MHLHHATNEVDNWISPLLPDRSSFDTAIKLVEEASELLHAIHHVGDVGQECADILILLLDVAHLHGVNLTIEFAKKMEINRKREWTERQGTLKHK
jgi:NTP pyrophosphatase (non-canonical NTP hydrolase)